MKQEKIRQAYTEYVLDNGKEPKSVYAFCKKLELKEEDFYDEYSSFTQIESDIWKVFLLRHVPLPSVKKYIKTTQFVRNYLLFFIHGLKL